MHVEPYAFFDDAGKWQDRDFICLCGYLSEGPKWEEFTQSWNAVLSRHGMPHLHMATFYHEAKVNGWSNTKANDVLLELAAIVRKQALIGFAVGLDAKYYRSLPKEKKNGITKPHVACLQRILRMIRDRLRDENYLGRITFTLDEEEGSAVELYRDIIGLRRSRPDLGHYIGAVCFADDRYLVPLQAADLFANLNYRWLRDRTLGKASAEELPEPLKSLIVDPAGRSIDLHDELWNEDALRSGIEQLTASSEV
jgi:hypothetical protein